MHLGLHAGPCPSVIFSLCPHPVPLSTLAHSASLSGPLCLNQRRAGQGRHASFIPPHYPSANSSADAQTPAPAPGLPAAQQVPPSQSQSCCREKSPGQASSCSSAYRSRDKVFQLFPTRQMLRGQRRGRGTGAGGGEPCGRPHRYHTRSTHTPLDPLQNLTATSPPSPHTETLSMLPAPATPAWCPQPVPFDSSRSL